MFGRLNFLITPAALVAAIMLAAPASAQVGAPQLRDSFPIGDSKGALCQVQSTLRDPVASGMFDRGWLILCRDAAQPVGTLRLLKTSQASAEARIAAARPAELKCTSFTICHFGDARIDWHVGSETRGGLVYVVEGYAAYSDALKLALSSIANNQIAVGTINVATTSAGSGDGFARDLAGNIDIDQALSEGYRRNHSGNYADAAEFFEALGRRADLAKTDVGIDPTEFSLNRALQKSNLGEFGEAERLFSAVEAIPTADFVQLRLRRNYRAIHALNQGEFASAIAILSSPLPAVPSTVIAEGSTIALTRVAAAALNSGANARTLRQSDDEERLTPEERAAIIDAQAMHLRGTAERLQGNAAAARDSQSSGMAAAAVVRDGRVTSIIRLRSQMLGELALAEEALGNIAAADARFTESVTLLASEFPDTVAVASARARHAAFMVRQNRDEEALALYRTLVGAMADQRHTLTGLANQIAPYFRLLAARSDADPAALNDFFVASQLMVRPGVADTQAILARELSSGSTEGARLFRQATNLARDIERARIEDGRLSQLAPSAEQAVLRQELSVRLAGMGRQQAEALSALAGFSQYRAIEQGGLSLAELQAILTDGEIYAKTLVVGETVYGLYADRTAAKVWTAEIGRSALATSVEALRASIAVRENGRMVTYPFDAQRAYDLFGALFGPIRSDMVRARHIVYEPDGAMLQLPISLLLTADTGLAAFRARLDDPEADAFDTRGLAFLGRSARTSMAVSPLAFRNARRAIASRASLQYFGAGQNTPITALPPVEAGAAEADCRWSLGEWNKPISANELIRARGVLGDRNSTLLTETGFTDTAVRGLTALNDYRILHFATHGLVTAPRPGCPARPALLTSFGSESSDGLLSFDEIFDLRIDADLVILSACDTAGTATVAATREAGVTTGGGSALDGLVRAFIGAGGRSVVASHWPVPDDFGATERLIGGLFGAPAGTTVADALWQAQQLLMADVRTSHPYYWSGFAIVGDGERALIRPTNGIAANGNDAGAGAR